MTLAAEPTTPDHFAAARRAMIDSQLRTSGVTEPTVIAAMARLPRERYLPEALRSSAYIDRALQLDGEAQFPAPLFHGRMLAEAALRPGDRVLVVESGTGYLADLVRDLAGVVTAVSAPEASGFAAESPAEPFDVLLVDGAAEDLPETLTAQLGEGGRVVTGLVDRGVTRLAVGRKVSGQISLLCVADIGVPVIAAFARPNRWSF